VSKQSRPMDESPEMAEGDAGDLKMEGEVFRPDRSENWSKTRPRSHHVWLGTLRYSLERERNQCPASLGLLWRIAYADASSWAWMES
jgi:hypothetical protein